MWFRSKQNSEHEDDDDVPVVVDPVAYELAVADATTLESPRLLITALGRGGDQIEASITSACNIARSDGRMPIVVCSDLPTQFLVDAEFPIEMLPRAKDLETLNTFEFRQYLSRRWDIVLGKWNVTEVINLAEGFDTFLTNQLAQVETPDRT